LKKTWSTEQPLTRLEINVVRFSVLILFPSSRKQRTLHIMKKMWINIQSTSCLILIITNFLMFIVLVSNIYERATSVESRIASIAKQETSKVTRRSAKTRSIFTDSTRISSKNDIYVTENVIQCEENWKPNEKVTKWSLLYWDTVQDGAAYGCKAAEWLNWALSLREHELQIYSKHGEDGVLDMIFEKIGTNDKFFVEFYVGDGSQCNTRALRSKDLPCRARGVFGSRVIRVVTGDRQDSASR
jgi:hypothetical protein